MNQQLTDEEREFLKLVEPSLRRGLDIRRWWGPVDAANSYATSFVLERFSDPNTRASGFFDTVNAPSLERDFEIAGVIEQRTFANLRLASEAAAAQIREFAFRYFLATTNYQGPSAFSLASFREPGADKPISDGWDFSQVFYKLRATGEIGKFSAAHQERLIDLRELRTTYEWVVIKARLFNYTVDISPFGATAPSLRVPIGAATTEYAVLSSDFIAESLNPAPGVTARYEIGYALLPSPGGSWLPLQWGPGVFTAGFQSFFFELRDSGEVTIASPFVVPRPRRLVGYATDLVGAALRLANRLSFGLAARFIPRIEQGFDPVLTPLAAADQYSMGWTGERLGLSVDSLERFMLDQHLMAVFRVFAGSAHLFGLVPDWTVPPSQIPEWILPAEERAA